MNCIVQCRPNSLQKRDAHCVAAACVTMWDGMLMFLHSDQMRVETFYSDRSRASVAPTMLATSSAQMSALLNQLHTWNTRMAAGCVPNSMIQPSKQANYSMLILHCHAMCCVYASNTVPKNISGHKFAPQVSTSCQECTTSISHAARCLSLSFHVPGKHWIQDASKQLQLKETSNLRQTPHIHNKS